MMQRSDFILEFIQFALKEGDHENNLKIMEFLRSNGAIDFVSDLLNESKMAKLNDAIEKENDAIAQKNRILRKTPEKQSPEEWSDNEKKRGFKIITKTLEANPIQTPKETYRANGDGWQDGSLDKHYDGKLNVATKAIIRIEYKDKDGNEKVYQEDVTPKQGEEMGWGTIQKKHNEVLLGFNTRVEGLVKEKKQQIIDAGGAITEPAAEKQKEKKVRFEGLGEGGNQLDGENGVKVYAVPEWKVPSIDATKQNESNPNFDPKTVKPYSPLKKDGNGVLAFTEEPIKKGKTNPKAVNNLQTGCGATLPTNVDALVKMINDALFNGNGKF